MSKTVQAVLVILIVLLMAGGYWYVTHRVKGFPAEPNRPGTSTKAPVYPPLAPDRTPLGKGSEAGNANKPGASTGGPLLRAGESLEYAVNIAKLNSTIANIKVSVLEQKNSSGKTAWHLQAFAHTENPYRMIFELDDQFDSYSEPPALDSVQYELHLSERGQKVDSVQRLLTSPNEFAPQGMSGARVLPGTRDPLGLLQYLRSVDWSKTPEVHSAVYDGRKLYDVRAVLVGRSETVAVPAGKYNATKIEIHVNDNGTEMKDAHFLLYLSNDAAHTPVLLEAVLPIATASVELTKAR
ncbi:MAG TPA: DUF3108 domain-containing protein [Candidatus Acidoferrum sp.]|nr:DUF3108 domain-containing protein [Candidatus Acidoferrum sp.]